MMRTLRRKKKFFIVKDDPIKEPKETKEKRISGFLSSSFTAKSSSSSPKAGSIARIFSFCSPRSRGTPFSPTAINDVSHGDGYQGDVPAQEEVSNNSYSDDEIVHHSVTSLPPLSDNMAALEARTFAACDIMDRHDRVDCLVDASKKGHSDRISSTSGEESESVEAPSLSQNWLIDINNITIGRTIGHSSFATVTEGRFNGTRVAVKTIERDTRPNAKNNLEAFKREAEVNCQLRHPNIVLFMGICVQPTQVCIITELMSRGNVRDLLLGSSAGKIRLGWGLRQQWGLDTAQGMAYLHSHKPPLIHRDLKTTNLLVDRGMNVKICDFGLSRICSKKPMSAVGTVYFAAPEVLRQEQYTEKVDVFSFGTVLWELYMREVVFQGVPQIKVYNAVLDGDMPAVDDNCDPRFENLMKDCWSPDAVARPTFEEIIDRLNVLVDGLEDTERGY